MVGIGPGDLSQLTFKAHQALTEAQVIIGYSTYLELIPAYLEGKEAISSGMMKEVDRCQKAVEMALQGKKVVVVSSGDPGVYGMAGLVLELSSPHGIQVEVVPGVTAANAAAAVLGAPLMHDFTVISLSDLLTPWEVIEKRLEAAAAGDFIVILYNPASKKRKKQIIKAREIFLLHKDPKTPVGIVKNLYRDGQEVTISNLDNMLKQDIDMFTTVVVGNSKTYQQGNQMITPRGYNLP
ncbi:precorrin-3B C(17)-methyltransferase [Candidatus Contubernalis alkalaceticus]|nr:precorrin-3B C(17)-methyltransferase [Candidatus Contubernalis alkalaceticus]